MRTKARHSATRLKKQKNAGQRTGTSIMFKTFFHKAYARGHVRHSGNVSNTRQHSSCFSGPAEGLSLRRYFLPAEAGWSNLHPTFFFFLLPVKPVSRHEKSRKSLVAVHPHSREQITTLASLPTQPSFLSERPMLQWGDIITITRCAPVHARRTEATCARRACFLRSCVCDIRHRTATGKASKEATKREHTVRAHDD